MPKKFNDYTIILIEVKFNYHVQHLIN